MNWYKGNIFEKVLIIFGIVKRRVVAIKDRDSDREIKEKLSIGVQYVYDAGVNGDIAEFGTASGRSASIIAVAMQRFDRFRDTPKKLHLFDSFKGLPESESDIDRISLHVQSGIWSKGRCKGDKETLIKRCKKFLSPNRLIIYDGWFKNTLPTIPKSTKFSMIHIDSDLYQSAKEVLDYLFKNQMVQEGTVIFFDDYNCNRASSQLGERRAWLEIIKEYAIDFSDWGAYGWGGARFIVHSYHHNK